jgi:microcystin degradation protein MlrC
MLRVPSGTAENESMARIAVGGFQHETNTFAPAKAELRDFLEGGGWPALQRGPTLPDGVLGTHLPISGAIGALRSQGHEIVPLVWAAATPSAHVTEEAFEQIVGLLLQELAAALPVDGVYLDLHGAMVAEHLDDGEGEVLRRVRALVGPRVAVAASLDLHANVTPEMVALADLLVAYRTYPHVDMAETGARAAAGLAALLGRGDRPAKSFRQLPFLIPLTWQCTLMEPAASIFREIAAGDAPEAPLVSFTPGFPAADIHHCGPSIFAYGGEASAAQAATDRLLHRVAAAEADFAGRLYAPDDGVREALRLASGAARPVVLADTQDNPGAGGTSDTVGLLEALVRHDAPAVLAILTDPECAAIAHAAGAGAEVALALGGKSGAPGQAPFRGRFTVERLADGNFTGTGPMWGGVRCRLGPMALLRTGAVRVILASKKLQAADQAIFRHLGVEPAAEQILALKSSVHFRADFQPIAEAILVVAAPGPMLADPAELPFRRLRPGVRLRPLGPVHAG